MTVHPTLASIPSSAEMEARYQRAATIMQGVGTKNFVLNDTVFPQWIENTKSFWYERNERLESGIIGKQYRLIDTITGSNAAAFDHAALADALSIATGQTVPARDLPISQIEITLSPLTVCFTAYGQQWRYDCTTGKCHTYDAYPRDWVISPNGQLAVFFRNHNLWLQDLASHEERALTDDGEEFFVYGAVGTAWGSAVSSGLQAVWSPDSTQIFTVQRDTRQVKMLPVTQYVPLNGDLRPTVIENRVALPGDTNVENYRLLAINVAAAQACEAHYRRIPACRNGWGFFNAQLGWWASDSRRAYFIDQTRGDQVVRLVEFDTHTGGTRILFEETSETHINLSLNSEDLPPHMYIPETNELIWYSERSGWAHLYLYDLNTGTLKNTITHGEWLVRQVLHFNTNSRELIIQTSSRVAGRDPYYCDIARVQIDTGELTTLIATDHEYVVHSPKRLIFQIAQGASDRDIADTVCGVSPCGDYIVSTRSRADQVPVSLLLNRVGEVVCELETADISALPAGWQWPEPVKLTASGGATDIYGLVYRPSNFDDSKTYPVINFVLSCPDVPAVSKGSFINNEAQAELGFMAALALAQLGFFVVVIDGHGTPFRNKDFVDESYGWIPNSAQTSEHIECINQLALRYPNMDLQNVGILSMYGMPAVHFLFERPDFFKVGVVVCPQDSRLMSGPLWGEKYEGLSGLKNEHHYPEDMVNNFQGKLLLMHGMLDTCSTPATTFRLVEALHKADKDFDMFLLPNVGHDPSPFIRRSWDYLVRHLLKAEPPTAFKLAAKRLGVEAIHAL